MKLLIVLPIYNEELILKDNTLQVLNFCRRNFLEEDWKIIISDNNSKDKSPKIAKELSSKFPEIEYFYCPSPGKGNTVIEAWKAFESDLYIFMDVDLSADLKALPELVEEINKGYNIVVGSRFLKESQVKRSTLRKIISKGLNILLKILFKIKIKDTACGLKAVTKKVVKELVPKVKNKNWFFDTELLILAQKENYKIKETPIIWQEKNEKGRQSKVQLFKTIADYLKGIWRLKYVRK